MTERPEERLVQLLEKTGHGPEGHRTFRIWDYEDRDGVDLLPIARAMAEVVEAARETDRAFDATAFPALRTALQALDSLGTETKRCPECGSDDPATPGVLLDSASESGLRYCANPWHPATDSLGEEG